MNTQNLVDTFSKLQEEASNHRMLSGSTKNRLIPGLEKAKKVYIDLVIPERFKDLHESLLKRGNELLWEFKRSKDPKELSQKSLNYLRYVHASIYDFREDIRGLNDYTRAFLITAALFFALTPQFYGFVLPVVFVLPIFSGLAGVKRRNRTGLMMTLAVVPMAMMTSITWIRYFFEAALPNYHQAVAATSASWNISPGTAQLLIIVPSILSILLLAVSLLTAFWGYKYKDMFV